MYQNNIKYLTITSTVIPINIYRGTRHIYFALQSKMPSTVDPSDPSRSIFTYYLLQLTFKMASIIDLSDVFRSMFTLSRTMLPNQMTPIVDPFHQFRQMRIDIFRSMFTLSLPQLTNKMTSTVDPSDYVDRCVCNIYVYLKQNGVSCRSIRCIQINVYVISTLA